MKEIAVIGGGPAGLTAAYELQKHPDQFHVTLFEESGWIGGISRTAVWHGNRMDMGPHRFFSKSPEVNRWWEEILPVQGSPAKDDILSGRDVRVNPGGPDPEKTDEVMLVRRRLSRIFFEGKFYDYPISLKAETFRNMGLLNSVKCGLSYAKTAFRKLPEDNLENFYINSFGRQLYSMFFESYTENLWGRHPREIDASWGAQRTKGLSVSGIFIEAAGKLLHMKNRQENTSLIGEFKYPKLGSGELWEITAGKIRERGGDIVMNARVTGLLQKDGRICSLQYETGGEIRTHRADIVISSMSLKDLAEAMNDVPAEERRIAEGLPYRSYMILGVLVKKLALKDRGRKTARRGGTVRTVRTVRTGSASFGGRLPDSWIYVQDRSVRMGRFLIYNNFSPYLLKDPENTVWIGLEYFCDEGDSFWNQGEEAFTKRGIDEMLRIGLIRKKSDVLDTHMEKVKKAYPACFDTYEEIDRLKKYLDSVENLYCVGRNGQHRYNNMDHSVMTGLEAAKCILCGSSDRSAVWNVNTEKEYHEEKR